MDTPAKFRGVLLAAERIGYADPVRGATGGTQFAKALDLLNLRDELAGRLKVFPFGVEAVAALGRGELDLAVSMAPEILPLPEVSFVGLFPEELQIWTSYRAVAASNRPAAQEFMDVLIGPTGADAFQRVGFF
jgi:ABC-type molybdate transport system substrate-binding protein